MNIWWCKAKHLSVAYKKSLTFGLTVVIVTVKSSLPKQTSRTCRLSVLGDIRSCPVSERLFICVCGTLLWLSLTEPCRDRVSQHAPLRGPRLPACLSLGTGVVWQLWRETENWDSQLREILHELSSQSDKTFHLYYVLLLLYFQWAFVHALLTGQRCCIMTSYLCRETELRLMI